MYLVTGSCADGGAKTFTVMGSLFLEDEPSLPPVTAPPTTTVPLPPTTIGGPQGASASCTSGTIHDGTTVGVRTWLRVQAYDARTTLVCVRIESGGSGYGGQFVITVPPGPAVTGVPTNDTNSGACSSTPNGVPGPHPLIAGQIGNPSAPPYVPYLIDSYAGSGQAWVCVRAGTANLRVIVPTSGPGVTGLPTITFNADPGTPDPL